MALPEIPMNNEEKIELPEDVFFLFRDLMYEESGVLLDENSKFFVENRLGNSVRRLQLESFQDYYYYLKYDRKKDEEMANLLDLLTIHETYFFREEHQLKAFSDEIIPEKIKKDDGEKALRIWSAGCSTGEEAYTLAMILMENKNLSDWKIEIFATDISQRVLRSARRGVYQESAFRTTEKKYIDRYFKKEGTGYRILDEVKKNIVFLQLNLLDSDRLKFINPMDIIFCRNVIIYFDLEAKKNVVRSFHDKLKTNGYLLLGHSESLINISTAFSLRHFTNDMLYQKLTRTNTLVQE